MNKPQFDESIKGHKGYGLIHIIHGNGKGKTTSAIGTAVRCAGSGRRVLIVFFDKGGNDHYSERVVLDKIENIDYVATGRDRIDKKTGRFDFSVRDVDRDEALRGVEIVTRAFQESKYDLIILDEINSTVTLEIIDLKTVLNLIDNKPEKVELILTGRNPHEEMKKRAHLISRVELERHYFYSGVETREGIDY